MIAPEIQATESSLIITISKPGILLITVRYGLFFNPESWYAYIQLLMIDIAVAESCYILLRLKNHQHYYCCH